jgi:hypothetical protein
MREAAGESSAAVDVTPTRLPESTSESERLLLLECRMVELSSALVDARADADRLRGRLAEAAAREADHAKRYSFVQQELAEARADIVSLHEHLNRSEALRAKLEGHRFEPGSDAAELVRLRQELVSQRERATAHEQTATRLRARTDELLASRDTLLTRMAEWQRLVQSGNPEAVDLGEFIAELRQDILVLENRNAASERQEVALRELLARAGVDPGTATIGDPVSANPVVPTTTLPQPPRDTRVQPEPPEVQPDNLTFEGFLALARETDNELEDLWESGQESVADAAALSWIGTEDTLETAAVPTLERGAHAPVDGLGAADPVVRAASYGRLGRVFEDSPTRLSDHLRSGLADTDPRVRRRAVLAAATAPNLDVRPLLDPLRSDPDPHVRRVVREVLRHTPAAHHHVPASAELT